MLQEQDQLKSQLEGFKRLRDRLEEARVFFQMAEEEGATIPRPRARPRPRWPPRAPNSKSMSCR